MLGYTFKLEKVLNYKKDMENVKKGILGNINNKLNTEQEKLLKYNNHKEKLVNKKDKVQEKTNIRNLKFYSDQLKSISKDIEEQEKLIHSIKIELEKAKEELLESVKEKKTLEKLKEKDYDEFLNEMEKKQEEIIDNIVSFKNVSHN